MDEGAGSAVFDRTTLQEQGQTALEHRLTAAVERAVNDELRALEAARQSRQAAIDTPGEYRRVAAACG